MTAQDSSGSAPTAQHKRGRLLRKTLEQFIADAIAKHGDKYDYKLVDYINDRTSIKIICKDHGQYEQSPNQHLRGKGCPKCASESIVANRASEFISAATILHGNRYGYELVDYSNSHTKIKIICNLHGIFDQSPACHLSGRGCLKCSGLNNLTTAGFIDRATAAHGETYDYSQVEYTSNRAKVKISCKKHGAFEQVAKAHLRGNGCQKCHTRGFRRSSYINLSASRYGGFSNIYVVELSNESELFFKVGITVKSIAERFHCKSAMPYSLKQIKCVRSGAEFIFDLENRLHSLLADHRYKPRVAFKGDGECFTHIPSAVLKLLDKIECTDQMQLIA